MPFSFPETLAIIHNDVSFWLVFATLVLSTSILTTVLKNVTSVITCTIYSTFMMVLPLDYYFGSCLKYMIINLIRRATVEGFNNAIVLHPTQTIGTDFFITSSYINNEYLTEFSSLKITLYFQILR